MRREGDAFAPGTEAPAPAAEILESLALAS
jgi:hypothetical protein